MPVITVNAGYFGNEYDTEDVLEWLIERGVEKALKKKRKPCRAPEGDTYEGREFLDSDQELAHLRHWQIQKIQIEVRNLESTLIDADEVEHMSRETDGRIRAIALAIPAPLARAAIAAVPDRRAVEEACRDLVYRALDTIARVGEISTADDEPVTDERPSA